MEIECQAVVILYSDTVRRAAAQGPHHGDWISLMELDSQPILGVSVSIFESCLKKRVYLHHFNDSYY